MLARRGPRVGAAAFVVGLALVGPQTMGVAAADNPDTESSPSSSSPDKVRRPDTGPARSNRPVRAAGGASSASSPSATPPVTSGQRGAPPVPAAAIHASVGPVTNDGPPNLNPPDPIAGGPDFALAARVHSPWRLPTPQPRETAAVPAPSPESAGAAAASASSSSAGCSACWGATAPTIGQAANTVINHLFNSAFDWLSNFPANPISGLFEGALVLLRRSLFLSPEGLTASQVGTSLTISVNTGSVAYFRQDGTTLQVSGDPWFLGAKEFDAATVSTVAVANPGDAGCAGLVVDSGLVSANLTTSQIDAIRFNTGAAFAGTLRAEVTGGPLTLRNAVRGLDGLTLDAAVVLGSDVEVDAGTGDATFTGTVDAARAGNQSLTVTALGTTTFAAAVGGQFALASLLTRGIAPLTVQQSNDTRTVPLHYMPQYGGSGDLQVKYGIDVAIGNNPPRTFVFDTGGNGFYAGYNPEYWQGVALGTNTTQINYTSGTYYDAVATDAVVTLGPAGGPTVSTVQPVRIGAILSAGNSNTGQTYSFTNPYAPPVDGRFSGDFGAAFGVQPVSNQTAGLSSVLFQLPGNLSSGYLVQLGPIGTDPSLTVGVTDALRAQFPYAIPVAANAAGGTYPISGYQVLQQFGFNAVYSVQRDDDSPVPLGTTFNPQCAAQCLPSLIDSGAPSTNVRLPGVTPPYPYATDSKPSSELKPGTNFIAQLPTTAGRPPLTWTFVAGNNGSVNQVGYSANGGAAFGASNQNVNTGLNIFNAYDIMFDVQQQVIWLRPNDGQAQASLQSVTTTGTQTYQQNATLGGTYTTGGQSFTVGGVAELIGDTTVTTGGGDVTFSGTVDGPHALAVSSTGTTTFVRAVGGLSPLTSLTTDAGGSSATASVSTTGNQLYRDATALNGGYQVSAGAFTAGANATLAGTTQIQTNGGDITFAGRIDSTEKTGFTLNLTTDGRHTYLRGKVGGSNALGGLNLVNSLPTTTAYVTADDTVNLDGSLGYSGPIGLAIGGGVTATFSAEGSSVGNFTASGVVFYGDSPNSTLANIRIANNVYDGIQIAATGGSLPYDYTGTRIANNTIIGNGAFGIETAAPVSGLTISGNTIGAAGKPNQWDYVTTDGPNLHGIVLAPGEYAGSSIAGNKISFNQRSGIYAPSGVQRLQITGNTLSSNESHGIEFADGDFIGTVISGNTITANASAGISLGAGIGQGTTSGGNPLGGYTADGHYIVNYANNVNFYDPKTQPGDPQIAMKIGSKGLQVNMDTGSRGLYFDQLQLDSNVLSEGTVLGPGHVYLNSSNRLYFGTWVQLPVTFTGSYYQTAGGAVDDARKAVANMPVLVVEAIGASTTPKPGQTQANTTFGTTVNSGAIQITDGTTVLHAPIVPNLDPNTGTVTSTGTVTIPGGFYAFYQDNIDQGQSKLSPVANFGVGFDRSGIGTAPTANGTNQEYNAFLNIAEMQNGAMRPGYVITTQNVQLGLDSSVQGFAYTNLAPSGLTQGDQSAPDWQPATGTVAVGADKSSNIGPLVLDMGYPGGILTLPRYGPTQTFTDNLTVNLLNSAGEVSYTVTASPNGTYDRTTNLLNPAGILLFNPLPGAYTQNTPPLNQQFFNTGRNSFAAFQYLYDAAAGYLGLKVAQSGPERAALNSADGKFTPDYYANTTVPTKVTDLKIENNTIYDNSGFGVSVTGPDSAGIQISANSIYGNAGLGIALRGGANGGQNAPTAVSAKLTAPNTVTVTGTVSAVPGYSGTFTVQVFGSPSSDGADVEGRNYLGEFIADAGSFTRSVPSGGTRVGDLITLTATPVTAPLNTSQFSPAAGVTPA